MKDTPMTDDYSKILDRVQAMPFRPALPMNRAVLRRLGLSVGIAIALSGCATTVFVWTISDLIGLTLLGLVIAFVLLLLAVAYARILFSRVTARLRRRTPND